MKFISRGSKINITFIGEYKNYLLWVHKNMQLDYILKKKLNIKCLNNNDNN